MSRELTRYISLVVGSLIVALSGTIVAIYSPPNNIIGVFLGYIVFVLGYKTCWFGSHQKEGIKSLKSLKNSYSIKEISLKDNLEKFILVVLGLYLASYGTVQFFNLVENPGLIKGLETGLTSFGGYIMAHEAVNEAPI